MARPPIQVCRSRANHGPTHTLKKFVSESTQEQVMAAKVPLVNLKDLNPSPFMDHGEAYLPLPIYVNWCLRTL